MKKKIAQICEVHRQQDDKKFYRIIQLFLFDSIQLISSIHFTEYEKIIISYAKKMYLNERNYNIDVFKGFRIVLAEKKYSEDPIAEERINVFGVINGFLTPFEEYEGSDEIYRPYELQYSVDFFKKTGLKKKELKKTFKKHFGNYLK